MKIKKWLFDRKQCKVEFNLIQQEVNKAQDEFIIDIIYQKNIQWLYKMGFYLVPLEIHKYRVSLCK